MARSQPLFIRVCSRSECVTTCYVLRGVLNEVCTKLCTKFPLHVLKR
jgi:hypothetical protein